MKYLVLVLYLFLFTVQCNAQKVRRSSSSTNKDAHKSQGSSEYRSRTHEDLRSEITYPDVKDSIKDQCYGGSNDMRDEQTEKAKEKANANGNDKEQQSSKSKQRETEHHGNEVEQDGSVWM